MSKTFQFKGYQKDIKYLELLTHDNWPITHPKHIRLKSSNQSYLAFGC